MASTPAPSGPSRTDAPRFRIWPLLAFAAGIAGLFALVYGTDLGSIVGDQERLRGLIEGLGIWGPVAVIALEAVAIIASPIPSAPIAIASGLAFGPLLGTVYTVIGAEIGSIAAFLIARGAGREAVRKVIPRTGFFARLEAPTSQGWLMALVFLSRLAPFISFDAVSYAAGLTALTFWRFALATLAGVIPVAFLLNLAGSELPALGPWLAVGLVVVLGLVGLAPLVWSWTRRGRGEPPA